MVNDNESEQKVCQICESPCNNTITYNGKPICIFCFNSTIPNGISHSFVFDHENDIKIHINKMMNILLSELKGGIK